MTYKAGSLNKQQLMEEFGLNDQGLASSNKGSSTGTKYNPLLGDGYLQDRDVDRLLDNEKLQATWRKFGNVEVEAIPTPVVVVEEPAVVVEGIEGVDYPDERLSQAIERIDAYTNATHNFTAGPKVVQESDPNISNLRPDGSASRPVAFNAADWIARTSEPDYEATRNAQELANKYRFEIQQNLKPTEESIVRALNTAIPDKLGIYSS